MIRICISSLCFIFAISICFLGVNHIESSIIPLIEQIELANIYSNDENFEEVSNIMVTAKNTWERSCVSLGVLLRLNELDDIDDIFIRALEYAKNGDSSSFQIESAELIHRLEHLFTKEQLNFKNIF